MNRSYTKIKKFKFDKQAGVFYVDGRNIRFDTSYEVVNPMTGGSMIFDFKESTGSEWDPKTVWIYKSEEGYELRLSNEDVTPAHAEAYLEAKLRNM